MRPVAGVSLVCKSCLVLPLARKLASMGPHPDILFLRYRFGRLSTAPDLCLATRWRGNGLLDISIRQAHGCFVVLIPMGYEKPLSKKRLPAKITDIRMLEMKPFHTTPLC